MSDRDSSARRKVLLGLGGGLFGATQLPKTWTKPVVDSVLLPVHAETTDTDSDAPEIGPDFSGKFTFVESQKEGSNSLIENVLSVVVPDAHAGGFTPSHGEMCIQVTPPAAPGAAYTAKALIIETEGDGTGTGVYTASGTIGGGPESMLLDTGCSVGFGVTLDVSGVSVAGATFMLSSNNLVSVDTLPPGSDCPEDSTCD